MSEHHEETEAEFLARYQVGDYPRPAVTVDLVVFTVIDTDLKVLLIRRKGHPFKDRWALPGGFVRIGATRDDQGEDLDDAAHRELEEETHLPRGACYLEQLYTFGKAGRDPRTRVITVAYFALVRPTLAPMVTAGSDAAEVRWASVQELWDSGEHQTLAFDHPDILAMAVTRVRNKIGYTPIAFELVPETFTVNDMRSVYEAIKGRTYDPKTFNRRFQRMVDDGIIEQAPGKRITGARPAAVWRFVRQS